MTGRNASTDEEELREPALVGTASYAHVRRVTAEAAALQLEREGIEALDRHVGRAPGGPAAHRRQSPEGTPQQGKHVPEGLRRDAHLLQSALVLVNTCMVDRVLAKPDWAARSPSMSCAVLPRCSGRTAADPWAALAAAEYVALHGTFALDLDLDLDQRIDDERDTVT